MCRVAPGSSAQRALESPLRQSRLGLRPPCEGIAALTLPAPAAPPLNDAIEESSRTEPQDHASETVLHFPFSFLLFFFFQKDARIRQGGVQERIQRQIASMPRLLLAAALTVALVSGVASFSLSSTAFPSIRPLHGGQARCTQERTAGTEWRWGRARARTAVARKGDLGGMGGSRALTMESTQKLITKPRTSHAW